MFVIHLFIFEGVTVSKPMTKNQQACSGVLSYGEVGQMPFIKNQYFQNLCC